jgi:uracil-DNA glycosylase family 4
MSDPNLTPQELARQAQQHLQSLKAAGVEWLPTAPLEAPPLAVPAPPVVSLPVVSNQPNLFEEPAPAAGSPTELTLEQRRRALELLAEQVSTCSRCPELMSTRTQTVFGHGPLDPELCFIGEAPGADEDAQGLPFVGAAGQLLNRIIAACGMKREEVFVCNILRCRPPGNRTPQVTEAANCREYLEKTLELVRPKFLCALGGCAAQNLLNTTTPLGRLRKRFHDYRGIPVLCTYHPAFLLPHRSPEKKKDVWEDMKMLMARMGRQIPTRS